jgi:hypothetical protein
VNSAKTYLIALLTLTTIGAVWYAWRQHAEIAELRAAAMNKEERANLQKRLWDLEKLNRELQDQRAGGQRGEPGRFTTGPADGEGPPRDFPGRGGRGDPRGFGPQVNAMRDLMTKPEVQAMINLQQQVGIDARYAALFKNLNLQPEQVDRLKTLLAERTTTLMDVAGAAFEQGINPRQNPDAFQKLVGDAQNAINTSIKEVIGDAGFAQLTNYEQTMPQRNVVEQLDRRLSYSNTPLTAAQSEQLVQILAANAPPQPAGAYAQTSAATAVADFHFVGPPPGRGPGPGSDAGFVMAVGTGPGPMGMVDGVRVSGPTSTVTDTAVAQSTAILSPPQVQALQQIQQQQQSQQQLRQMMNETMTANQPPGKTGGTSSGQQQQPARKRPGG